MDTNRTPSLDEMWTMFQRQQAAMQGEIAALKAQLQEQRVEKLALSSRLADVEEGRGAREKRLSRSGLLKAAAAGVAGLAGAGALGTQTVAAAGIDGDVGLGVTNTTGANNSVNNQTTIQAASGMTGNAVFRADAYNGGVNTVNRDGLQGQGSGSYSGVAAWGGPNGGDGVFGYGGGTTGSGVVGVAAGATNPAVGLYAGVVAVGASSFGLYAVSTSDTGAHVKSTTGTGIYGESGSSYGVFGNSTSNIGVAGVSGSFIDVAAGGTGRLYVVPQSTAGAPTTGSNYYKGELIVDSNGVPYVCTAPGTPGTWQAVGNLRSFPGPHRVFGDGSVTTSGTTTSAIDATAGGVPAGVKAAYCAVQATAQGVMTLYPDGTNDPGIANWANTGAQGQLALFYMLVPLSSAGKFRIHTYLTGQIYVDVWGYLY